MNFHNVEFLISAASTKDFPQNRLPEIAFAGKSNVGKSSVINRVLNRKNFARVGDKPGKTIHVNYFTIDKKCYYFAANRIDLGVLIVDYRHAPTNNDITMARWFIDSGCPFVVLANKMDKLKKSELEPNLKTIREDLELPNDVQIIPFSAEKGNGKEELVRLILATVKE